MGQLDIHGTSRVLAATGPFLQGDPEVTFQPGCLGNQLIQNGFLKEKIEFSVLIPRQKVQHSLTLGGTCRNVTCKGTDTFQGDFLQAINFVLKHPKPKELQQSMFLRYKKHQRRIEHLPPISKKNPQRSLINIHSHGMQKH